MPLTARRLQCRSCVHTQLRRQSTRSSAHQQRQFELLVPALQTFQRLRGHFAVPLRFIIPSSQNPEAEQWPDELQGMKLGTTISRFLKASAVAKKPGRKRSLDEIREKLQELGLPDVRDWKRFLWEEVSVPAMRTYSSMHGDLFVPVSFMVPVGDDAWPRSTWGYKLGYWTSELRRCKDKLPQYQLEDLSELGFNWNAREGRWNRYFLPALQKYHEIYSNRQVPQRFVVPSDDPEWPAELGGYRLGQKVNNLRCGDPTSNPGELQDIDLLFKNWMLLETLHEVSENGDGVDDTPTDNNNEETYQ